MPAYQPRHKDGKNGDLLQKEQLGIEWERTVEGEHTVVLDLITLHNYGLEPCTFPLTLQFRAAFEDIFAVRGLLQEKLGKLEPPRWQDGQLSFMYAGADGLYRGVNISFSEGASKVGDTTVEFDLSLKARELKEISVALRLVETDSKDEAKDAKGGQDMQAIHAAPQESGEQWLGSHTQVNTDNQLLNGILNRSLRDLRTLRSSLFGHHYYAAGLPWFGTLFGRDSAITCLQTLAFHPEIAADTLRLLAQLQGKKVDDYKDEQPGKILHSIRVGEMARTGEIPHSPYYGSVDATPLFLILMGQYADWTGDLSLFRDLRDHVERALEWIARYGDTNGDGCTDYESNSEKGLINQGWKDSGDAIVDADGSLAKPPIAMIEVQGYVYMAKQYMAGLFRRVGDTDRAQSLEKEASELKLRFNRDFWLDKEGFYAMALQKDGGPCAVPSSNPGQALWTGIVNEGCAQHAVEMLLSDPLYNGWGIRTLSDKTVRYNPVSYHLGTVWPHDNAIIAAGLRRYGFDKEARKVYTGIADAAMQFKHYRLPELFAGFSKQEYGVPVNYPVTCHPQAWAAGSVPYMLTILLGLTPRAFDNCLRIVGPVLPELTEMIEIFGLKVGRSSIDLRFEGTSDGGVRVTVLKTEGDLEVKVEQAQRNKQ